MINPSKTIRCILLVLGLLTSGCHVLSIPSTPLDGLDADRLGGYGASDGCCSEVVGDFSYAGVAESGQACDDGCPADWLSPLPQRHLVAWPVPKRLAEWRARRDLPEPPAYPRFHPLPTRPMFQPPAAPGAILWNGDLSAPSYGKLPNSLQGPDVWQPTPAPAQGT